MNGFGAISQDLLIFCDPYSWKIINCSWIVTFSGYLQGMIEPTFIGGYVMSFGESNPKRKALALSLVLLFASSGFAAPGTAEVDNTKINQRDAGGKSLTPEDQSRGNAADVELTRKIRRELVNDKSLSTDAQNIKIITLNGVVTLRGPVASGSEKAKIDILAKKVSGVKQVENQTEVKTKSY